GEFAWLSDEHTTLAFEQGAGRARWWTFAGDQYNAAVAALLEDAGVNVTSDGLGLDFVSLVEDAGARQRLEDLIATAQRLDGPEPIERQHAAVDDLKFVE